MNITVNDKPYTVDNGTTVETLLPIVGIAPTGIAVAVNGTVVSRPDWKSSVLTDGASIVVLKAFYGG